MPIHREIDKLEQNTAALAKLFIKKLEERGIRYRIIETLRDKVTQEAYWARGREPYETVVEKYKAAGLQPPSPEEANMIITKTKNSKHLLGKAIDIVPVRSSGTIPWVIKDASDAALWLEFGEIGESCGFLWGGRWEPRDKWGIGWDPAHYEI